MSSRFFTDRREAGRALAQRLRPYRGKAVVYALPRGGVETAVETARELDAPLGLIVSRKIGHPFDPEYAVCAVTETGPMVCDENEQTSIDQTWLQGAEAGERAEAKRQAELYSAVRRPVATEGKTAVIVDDGIATGLTMHAAIAELQKQHPKQILVAVPCAPRDTVDELLEVADGVTVLSNPDEYLGAVGTYYDVFPQLTDDDVMALLDEADQIS